MGIAYKITIHKLHHYEKGLDILERAIRLYQRNDSFRNMMSVSVERKNGALVIEASGRDFALERRVSDLKGYEFLSLYAGPVMIEKKKTDNEKKAKFSNGWGAPY